MPRESKGLTHHTRLRLTEEERQQVAALQKWYRDPKTTQPLSFNDTVRRAITVAYHRMQQSPVGPNSQPPAPAPDARAVVAKAAAAMRKPTRRPKFDPEAPAEHIDGQTEIEVTDQ